VQRHRGANRTSLSRSPSNRQTDQRGSDDDEDFGVIGVQRS